MRQTLAPWFKELLADHQPPCISIYHPVHRSAPPAHEDPLRFQSLLRQAEESLGRKYSRRQIEPLLEKLRQAGEQISPRGGPRDAVAVFVSPDYFQILDLQTPTEPAAIVADTFRVMPLIWLLQQAGRFHVLCMTQKRAEMFECDQFRIDKLELRNVPEYAGIVAGMRLSHEVTSVTDLAEARNLIPDEGQNAPLPDTIEPFLRAVDKAVWENYSRVNHLPLILAAVESIHPIFQRLSRNQYLLKEGIKLDPKNLAPHRLHQEAWKIIAPKYSTEVDQLKDRYFSAKARRFGSDQLEEVAQAAANGRVGTLMVESNRQVSGHLHRDNGHIEPLTIQNPHGDDLLDDLAELVLKTDGQVLVLPGNLMPTDSGIAAIYRY